MTSNIELGKPTEYGFSLPKIRYELSKKYLPLISDLMLDFGCGNGANTVLFQENFKKIHGVDVERDRIEEANSFLDAFNISNIEYAQYEGRELPFDDRIFDVVTSFEVLEHTNDDLESLMEINRVLKDNGLLIMSVPNKWYLMETHGFHLPFEKTIPWNRIPFLSWLPKFIHSRFAKARIYTKSDIYILLQKTGFKTINHEYIQPPFDKVSNKLMKSYLKRIFSFLSRYKLDFIGVSHFLVCQKSNSISTK